MSDFVPMAAIGVGAYLLWFGVHYFRDTNHYPHSVIKSVVSGGGLPSRTEALIDPSTGQPSTASNAITISAYDENQLNADQGAAATDSTGGTPATTTPAGTTPASGSASGSALVAEMEKLGEAATGYSETLDSGTGPQYYDCSGLVQTAFKDLGVTVPRDTESQWAYFQQQGTAHTGTPSSTALAVGDLVYATFAGDSETPGHVGVYTGSGEMYSAQDEAAGIGFATLASWESSGTINGWVTVAATA